MRFVIYGWGLSYLGGICHMWGDLSYMGIKSYSRRFHHSTSVYRSPYSTNPTHIWRTPPYMTNPGFCRIWAPIYWGTVMKWSRIIIIWDFSPRFFIYGEYTRFDKSQPCMTNPSTPRWVGKTQAVFSTNERARFWSCDPFLTNHKAQFLHLKTLKGLALQKNSQWGLSYMGGVCHIWVGFVICGGICHIWV